MATRIHMDAVGEGPDVVVLHGAPHDPRDAAQLGEPLTDAFRVWTVHLPGYGKSPVWPERPYSIPAVGAAVVEALGDRGVTEMALLGISGGSYRAFQIALDHSEIDLWATAHLGALATLDDGNREAMRQFGQALAAGVDMADAAVGRVFGPRYAAAHPERARAYTAAMLGSADRAGVEAELTAFAELEDLRPRLGALRVPTYLRVGALDQATPRAYSEEIAGLVPSAILDVVDDVGHSLQHEDRDATLAALRGFFRVNAPR